MKHVEDNIDDDSAKYFMMNYVRRSTDASSETDSEASEVSANQRASRSAYATNGRATRPVYPTNGSAASQGGNNRFEVLIDTANEVQSSENVNSNQNKILNVSNAKGSPFLG